MNLAPTIDDGKFEVPDQFKQRLLEATKVSWYGRQFFRGLHTYSGDHGTWHRIKVYAAAVFGSFFYGATTYFSFDGSVRMVDTSLQEDPIPSNVGHGGEWMQQPFQYGLAIHIYLLNAFANRGCLEEVKEIYREIVDHLVNNEGKDITGFYEKLEKDVLYLANRTFTKSNLLEVRLFLADLFRDVDTDDFPCRPLKLDKELTDTYRQILRDLKESASWSLVNISRDAKDSYRLLKDRGVGQAIGKAAGVAVFDAAMLVSVAFMIWGMSIVFDEVFISKTSPESSGHLSEWSINILTNLFLIYLVYSWTIKREVTLQNTRRVMMRHLQSDVDDLEGGGSALSQRQKQRLIEGCNHHLDQLAEKCQFNTLPSQYHLDS